MIKILTETKNDYQSIRDVNELAFGQIDEAMLVEKLRQHDNFIPEMSLVAKDGSMVVGHILFFPVKIIGVRKQWDSLALAPMAVLPEYQNRGIGSMLVQRGLQKAAETGFTNCQCAGA